MKNVLILTAIILVMTAEAGDTTMVGPLCKYQTFKRNGWDVTDCHYYEPSEMKKDFSSSGNLIIGGDNHWCQTAKPHYDTVSWEAACRPKHETAYRTDFRIEWVNSDGDSCYAIQDVSDTVKTECHKPKPKGPFK